MSEYERTLQEEITTALDVIVTELDKELNNMIKGPSDNEYKKQVPTHITRKKTTPSNHYSDLSSLGID